MERRDIRDLFHGTGDSAVTTASAPRSRLRPAPSAATLAMLTGLGLFACAVSWALATPLLSAPDEHAHVATAFAAVRGALGESTVNAPSYLAELPCFARNATVTADCQDLAATQLVAIETQFGSYIPLYYLLVGWPSLVMSGATGMYGMRIASAALFAALTAAAVFLLLRHGFGRWGVTGLVLSLTPMTMFLSGTVNGSSFEIAAATLTAAAAISYFRRQLTWSVVVALTIGLSGLVLSRPLSPLWALTILAAAAVASPLSAREMGRLLRVPRAWIPILAAVTTVTGAALWITTHPPIFLVTAPPPASLAEAVEVFLRYSTLDTPVLFQQAVGILGWLDTPVGWAWITFALLWGAFAYATLQPARRRERIAILSLAVIAIVLPTAITTALWSGVGWQGRYTLPLVATILILAGVSTSVSHAKTRFLVFATGAVTSTWLFALFVNGIRYSFGLGVTTAWDGARWTPPLGYAPWSILLVCGAVSVIAAVSMARPTTKN